MNQDYAHATVTKKTDGTYTVSCDVEEGAVLMVPVRDYHNLLRLQELQGEIHRSTNAVYLTLSNEEYAALQRFLYEHTGTNNTKIASYNMVMLQKLKDDIQSIYDDCKNRDIRDTTHVNALLRWLNVRHIKYFETYPVFLKFLHDPEHERWLLSARNIGPRALTALRRIFPLSS